MIGKDAMKPIENLTAAELLEAIERAGGRIVRRGGQVVLRGPASITTPTVIKALRRLKNEVTEVQKGRCFEAYRAMLRRPHGKDAPPVPARWMCNDPRYRDRAWGLWWAAFDQQGAE